MKSKQRFSDIKAMTEDQLGDEVLKLKKEQFANVMLHLLAKTLFMDLIVMKMLLLKVISSSMA